MNNSLELDEMMDPNESPNDVSGVRRVNNLPIFIIGGAVLAFLVIMMMVAADRANQQQAKEEEQSVMGDSSMLASKIAGSQTGLVPAREPTPPIVPEMQNQPQITIAQAPDLNAPPMPPVNQPQTPADEEAERIRQMKFQQLLEALKAKTSVAVDAPRSTASAPVMTGTGMGQSSKDPMEVYKTKLVRLQQNGLAPSNGNNVNGDKYGDDEEVIHAKNDIEQFANKQGKDRWRHDYAPEAPRTPYELRAGFVIPGTLISGINSDLPGKIIAQVSQNVYDTPIGKYLLIPQGSRLVGEYSSEVNYGQARVLVAWQRIVFPDGKAMDIGAMPGADSAGYAGFNDLVDNHYLRIFGSALLMSAITAGVQYSQQGDQVTSTGNGFYSQNASSVLSQALGQQLGQTMAQMIRKNMNIAPTLEIRPGYRFNIMVAKDLTFSKPYQSFDY